MNVSYAPIVGRETLTAKLADIAERTSVTLAVKGGLTIHTTLLEDAR